MNPGLSAAGLALLLVALVCLTLEAARAALRRTTPEAVALVLAAVLAVGISLAHAATLAVVVAHVLTSCPWSCP